MVYDWSDEEKEAVFGSRKLSPDNFACRFYYLCHLVIVNEPVFGESLEIAPRILQKDGMKRFFDKIILSTENIPVALPDQGSSELMDIITKINYAMEHFETPPPPPPLPDTFVYVKPKTAKFTFVQMMDTERYLLKLMATSALREGILKLLTTLHRLMSNSACELFPQLTPGGPTVGVNNERFSAKVKLRCKLDIHTALLSPPVYLRCRVELRCFQGVT